MTTISGKRFGPGDLVVVRDGETYVGCHFEGCRISPERVPADFDVSFVNCHAVGDVADWFFQAIADGAPVYNNILNGHRVDEALTA